MGRSNGFKTFLLSAAGTLAATLLFGGAVNAFRGDKEKEKETPKVEQTIEYDEVAVEVYKYDESLGMSNLADPSMEGLFRWYFKYAPTINDGELSRQDKYQGFLLNNFDPLIVLGANGIIIVDYMEGTVICDAEQTKEILPYKLYNGYVEFELKEGQEIDLSKYGYSKYNLCEGLYMLNAFNVNNEGEEPELFILVEKGTVAAASFNLPNYSTGTESAGSAETEEIEEETPPPFVLVNDDGEEDWTILF